MNYAHIISPLSGCTFVRFILCRLVRSAFTRLGLLGAVVGLVPFALATSATVLLFLLSVRIVVVLSCNVTLGATLFDSFGFRRTSLLSSLVIFSVNASKTK